MIISWKNLPLRLTLLALSIVLFFGSGMGFYFGYKKNNEIEKTLVVVPIKIEYRVPKRLMVPSIGVDAAVEEVGMTKSGEMGVPGKITEVGWFGFGPRPGVRGSAVMAGHLNGKSGERGVFADLDKVRIGDKFFVEDEMGMMSGFVVRDIKDYDPGFAVEVFEKADSSYLNLITCDGEWSSFKKSYSKRLVIFGELET